jgi:hypothetical protein
VLLDPDPASGLVGQQGHQFIGESPERRRVGVAIPQGGELVSNERVINHEQAHVRKIPVCEHGDVVSFLERSRRLRWVRRRVD